MTKRKRTEIILTMTLLACIICSTVFNRVDNDLSKSFGRLDSGAWPVGSSDRLRILHDFFRPGDEQHYHFELSETIRKGHDFRDYITPDSLQFKAGHFDFQY